MKWDHLYTEICYFLFLSIHLVFYCNLLIIVKVKVALKTFKVICFLLFQVIYCLYKQEKKMDHQHFIKLWKWYMSVYINLPIVNVKDKPCILMQRSWWHVPMYMLCHKFFENLWSLIKYFILKIRVLIISLPLNKL